VLSNYVNKVELDKSVENFSKKSRKAYRKELKKKRALQGDPSQASFSGPWATYEG